jgi:homocysteine S-methyltransferase
LLTPEWARRMQAMPRYHDSLPQLSGDLFLADAGIETDLIFNHGIEIRQFAAHTLLPDVKGRQAVVNYFRGFLSLAREQNAGFVLDTQTWKAHPHWARDLDASDAELREANRDSVELIAGLREEYADNAKPIVLNGVIGPRGDAYAPEVGVAADEAEAYHAKQVGWLAETEVDMISAVTFTQPEEAIGLVRAARRASLPVAISFTVETDGRLPGGSTLKEAILSVDEATGSATAYFMVNCAHPEHFSSVLEDADWARRIRGLRCNASRKSHEELDQSESLDCGDPVELGQQYKAIVETMPWLNLFGGCCGSDLRHVTEIARALAS